jgi:hypothetical protein
MIESRKQASQVVKNLLGGRIDCISATRALLGCWQSEPGILSLEEVKLLKGINNETEELPIGLAREHWHPDALLEKDNEIARCERVYGAQIRSICERVKSGLDDA